MLSSQGGDERRLGGARTGSHQYFLSFQNLAGIRAAWKPVELDVFSTFVVTGGTGQFAGLSFSGTANGFVQFTSSNSGVSRLTRSAVPELGFGLLLGGIGIFFSLKR